MSCGRGHRQAHSYSQAETCRILLCTTRQQHPCAGTDRNEAQVGKALSGHCVLLHFWNVALRLCCASLCDPGLLLRAGAWEDTCSRSLEFMHSFIHSSVHSLSMSQAPTMCLAVHQEGHLVEKDPCLEGVRSNRRNRRMHVRRCETM